MIQHNRDEEVCRAWDVLAEQDHTYHISEEYFHNSKIGGSLSISRENVLTSTKRCQH